MFVDVCIRGYLLACSSLLMSDTSGTQSVWDTFLNEMQPAVANAP